MLFTGFEDRGLMLSGVVLDVSPPSMCGILRSGPSGGETSRATLLNIRPRFSNPVNNITYNIGRESLNQCITDSIIVL